MALKARKPVIDRLNRSLLGFHKFKSAEDRRPDRGHGLLRS